MLDFHTSLIEKHAYHANPWGWLIMRRPTSFFYESPTGCGSKSCAQEVLALGTPFLWWLGAIAVAVVIGFWIGVKIVSKIKEDNYRKVVIVLTFLGALAIFFKR